MSAKKPKLIRRSEITRDHPLYGVKQLLDGHRFDSIIEADGKGRDLRVVLTLRTAKKLYADASGAPALREALAQAEQAAYANQVQARIKEKIREQIKRKDESIKQLAKRLAETESALRKATDRQELLVKQHQRDLTEKDEEIAHHKGVCRRQTANLVALRQQLEAKDALSGRGVTLDAIGGTLEHTVGSNFAPRLQVPSGGPPNPGQA